MDGYLYPESSSISTNSKATAGMGLETVHLQHNRLVLAAGLQLRASSCLEHLDLRPVDLDQLPNSKVEHDVLGTAGDSHAHDFAVEHYSTIHD